jgi:hypothetical protein
LHYLIEVSSFVGRNLKDIGKSQFNLLVYRFCENLEIEIRTGLAVRG